MLGLVSQPLTNYMEAPINQLLQRLKMTCRGLEDAFDRSLVMGTMVVICYVVWSQSIPGGWIARWKRSKVSLWIFVSRL